MPSVLSAELASAAARIVVEEGLEYGPAKRKAARAFGRQGLRAELPGNEAVEDEVRSYLDLFHADTQPGELRALRAVAAEWMTRLAEFRPHVTGAVWRGTATRRSSVHLELYCDDSKSAEIALLNLGIDFDVSGRTGPLGRQIDVLTLASLSRALGETVTLHLSVLDHDDLRGALKPDARGRPERGDLAALQRLIEDGVP